MFETARRWGVASALAVALSFGACVGPTVSEAPKPLAAVPSAVNAKLHRLEERLSHIPEVRSTILCETPGATVGIVHLKQIHDDREEVMALLGNVIRGSIPELSEHALAVLQEQALLVSMVQQDIYGTIGTMHSMGLRSIAIEGMDADDASAGTVALEYSHRLERQIGTGLFSPSPIGDDMFPLNPDLALRAARYHVIWYRSLAGIAGIWGTQEKEHWLRIHHGLKRYPKEDMLSVDFENVKYLAGGDLLAAADFGLRVQKFEDKEYSMRSLAEQGAARARAQRTGIPLTLREEYEKMTDGREDRFLSALHDQPPEGGIVVTTLGAGHAFGSAVTCPSAPPGTFDEPSRLSWRDNILSWNEDVGFRVSVLEVEPTMERSVAPQATYNFRIVRDLIDEYATRLHAVRSQTPEPER